MSSGKLVSKSCIPCKAGMAPLAPAEAKKLLEETPLWKLESGAKHLKRTFEFADFLGAMRFVNGVAEIAEGEGHHPDFAIHWNQVELTLWTHDIGGLHENDFILAAKIDRLLEEPSRPAGGVVAG